MTALIVGLLFTALWIWGQVVVAIYAKWREDNTRKGGNYAD